MNNVNPADEEVEIVNLVTAIEGCPAPTAVEREKSGKIATTTQLSESTELREEVEIVNLVNLLGAPGTAAAILLDCGSTANITNKRENLVNYVLTFSRKLRLADKSIWDVVGKGDMHVWSRLPNRSKRHLILHEVLFVPSFETNLVSLKELTKKGRVLVYYGHNNCVLSRDGRIL